ncbi:DUF1176 domain-containing protein [Roseibium aggregatum]|uniref:DUF1176 domain-containing protein n=1 Tax=Roseibium aggregatum TaxID=187304 RepID=A0A939EKU6_9HYPH|nr:DUF1176 domain-containing protein [Roseibium aggregatum]MBN9673584.1 DUF1176 domain-containing protein [Roseibium aggregatum]
MTDRILICLAASLAFTGGASAELAETAFGDWTLRCNAKGYCIAETDGEGSNGEAFRLKVERNGKPASQVYVTFRPKTQLETGLRARIEITGEEENYGYFGKAGKIYTGNEMTFPGDADRALMEQLRLGQEALIQIEYGGATGTLTYEVSLAGLTHALLKMDEEQDRIGRLDAIVAWGGEPAEVQVLLAEAEPASDTPAPAAPADDLPPPVMPSQETNNSGLDRGARGLVYSTGEIPDHVQMLGYRTLDCALDETVPAYGAQYFTEGDAEVWVVPCTAADANVPYYIATHIPFDPSLDESYDFETPPGFNRPNHALVNNLQFDPDTNQITGTTYYSPNYDCGAFERHVFEADSGRYTLDEYLEKSECDGVTGPPEGWPLSWTIDEMGD